MCIFWSSWSHTRSLRWVVAGHRANLYADVVCPLHPLWQPTLYLAPRPPHLRIGGGAALLLPWLTAFYASPRVLLLLPPLLSTALTSCPPPQHANREDLSVREWLLARLAPGYLGTICAFSLLWQHIRLTPLLSPSPSTRLLRLCPACLLRLSQCTAATSNPHPPPTSRITCSGTSHRAPLSILCPTFVASGIASPSPHVSPSLLPCHSKTFFSPSGSSALLGTSPSRPPTHRFSLFCKSGSGGGTTTPPPPFNPFPPLPSPRASP